MKSKILAATLTIIFLSAFIIPVQAQNETQYPVYIIQSGDTLSGIADRFSISLDSLETFNNITNPDSVAIGDRLFIPGLEGITGTLTTEVVQLGESLDSLTVKYHIEASKLQRLNHVTSPGEIYAGSSLILPYTGDEAPRVIIAKVDSSQTLLEVAAANNTTSWDLLNQNDRSLDSSFLPSDAIYSNSGNPEQQVSSIDTRLTDVAISPLPLVQGQTYIITVDSPQPVTLEGSLNGMPLHFFPLEGNRQIALQGVDAMAEPGLSSFILSGKFSDGNSFDTEQSVLLLDGGYAEGEPLYVDSALIDPAVTGPEDDLIESYTSTATPEKYWSGIFTSPGYYDELSASFGERRTYNDDAYTSFHGGVDFAGGEGLPIVAAGDGVVVYTGLLSVRGNATIIDHGWGVYTAYYHQSVVDVNVGDKVTAGQTIGLVGNTGRVNDAGAFAGAGSHLHWEVWVNGVQVNPIQWLNKEYP
jgi:murein DD-endopeptidase MepM/ murein hydrolase activator NlpD